MPERLNDKLRPLFGRRSVRVYREEPVSEELVSDLLKAAMAAPSACARDPWHFVVVRRRETLSRIATALPNGRMLANAALGLVVCGDIERAHGRELSYLLQDCSAAIENILLAAHLLGLGACWLGVHPRQPRVEAVRTAVELPEHIIPVSCIAIGWPGETPSPRTRFDAQRVHQERWNPSTITEP